MSWFGPQRSFDAWIFDLDGTLTVPAHDFDEMRRRLGVQPGVGLVEAMEEMSPARRIWAERLVEAWEWEVADRAEPASGAAELLSRLTEEGVRLGVLTRNTHAIALHTLKVIGFERYFSPQTVVGRHEATPKPHPAGVQKLLVGWDVPAGRAVMVGDHVADVQAGRAAGARAALLGAQVDERWRAEADFVWPSLVEVVRAAGR